MSYKKEIQFLLNNPYQIQLSVIGTSIDHESDYDYADERYKSKITDRQYRIETNYGVLNFALAEYDTKWEYHDGESNRWVENEEKSGISETIRFNKDFKFTNLTEKEINEFKSFDESISHFSDSVNLSHESEFFGYLEAASLNHYEDPNNEVLVLHRLPEPLLKHILERSKDKFEGLNTDKLIELNQALQNTSKPSDFLEKLSTLSESAQISTTYFAMKRTEYEVDRLLTKKHDSENHSEHSY